MSIIRSTPETETEDHIKGTLSKWFNIYFEVSGVHALTKRKKRIDFILCPKQVVLDSGLPNIPIGLELKTFKPLDGNKKQVIEVCKQAIDYRYTQFKMKSGKHFLPLILIYPPASHYLTNPPQEEGRFPSSDNESFQQGFHYLLSRLLGKFFIGELDLDGDIGFKIILCGSDYFVWKDNRGKRLNMNWGFEKYEELKKEIISKNLSGDEYENEILKIVNLLGI